MQRLKRIALAALAVATIGLPAIATDAQAAQPKYQVTSIKKIAPNVLHYLLSNWTGAGPLDAKMAALEAKMSTGGVSIEGIEGRQGVAGATGPAGPAGPAGPEGESVEGPQGAPGPASTIPGPAGPQGEPGEAGPEGLASEVPGPAGPRGEKGERGPACEVKVEPACASTVPGPRGEAGPAGAASTVPGPRGEKGESITGPAGPAGATGPQGERGEKGEPGSGGSALPITDVITNVVEHMPKGHKTYVFARHLQPGDYLITGSLSFENRHQGSVAESMECWVELGSTVIDETFSIAGAQTSGANTSSAIVVASTGSITQEELLSVQCEDAQSSGAEETYSKAGTLAATGVEFR